MAVGKPIVAFDLTEHRVTAQDAAVYARPNDENDLALKIAELVADPERRREMGRIGKDRIANSLSWPCQAPKLVEAYARLA
jgi:glycosyltransferase involved in cell wall biosynthesis